MRISVVGTGYVGLVAGACFADAGNNVTCIDKVEHKIADLKAGKIPIYEPGLEEIVKRGIQNNLLNFTVDLRSAISSAEIIFLAVDTPAATDGTPDTTSLKAAAQEIAKAMNGSKIIVNKSTVPVGANSVVKAWISEHTQHSFEVVSNPEFLKEGSAVDDFLKPDRIVVGTDSDWAYGKMTELYAPFVRQGNPILRMSPTSAELAKYACNAFLATRVSFMNEIANLCEKVGADVEYVRKAMALDERIGKHFLYPGVGYGGSCFPKDVKALIAKAREVDQNMSLVRAAEEVNEKQKHRLVADISQRYKGNLSGVCVAIWGLSFKPKTDDLREAPSLVVIDGRLKKGARVQVFDPIAMEKARQLLGNKITFANSSYQAVEGADALAIITEWSEFRSPDFEKIKTLMKSPVIFDGRNVFEPAKVKSLGFEYHGIGRS